ncbi:unnamed protein product [Pedinophyceae sp. YPF-701]|nr:unnamed protein product [Pedinophyceae sp. YPF-701]
MREAGSVDIGRSTPSHGARTTSRQGAMQRRALGRLLRPAWASVRAARTPSAPNRAPAHVCAARHALPRSICCLAAPQSPEPASGRAAAAPPTAPATNGSGHLHEPVYGAHTVIAGPPDVGSGSAAALIWDDDGWAAPLPLPRRVFCNRSLNMAKVRAVGFDLDYTLAQYKQDTFEQLAYKLTTNHLVRSAGYPKELLNMPFDWRYMQKGLTIDKRRGNVIKRDRHHYVKLAYHGFQELSREERIDTYAREVRESYDSADYATLDTLFSLAEAYLYMQLVELKDSRPDLEALARRDYFTMYTDVRRAVDECHRDGSLKREVARYPEKYIHSDPSLVPMLEMLRASGKRVFLATNSLWDYANVVMNYIIDGKVGDAKDTSWLRMFDIVVVGCSKPKFFSERSALFRVDPETGLLQNTDNGAPTVPVDQQAAAYSASDAILQSAELGTDDERLPAASSSAHPKPRTADSARHHDPAPVFQGGFYADLHRTLGVTRGEEVLYVGDHIYGDILRSKKHLGWRTMLVVPELEAELEELSRHPLLPQDLLSSRVKRDALEDQAHHLEWWLSRSPAERHGGGADERTADLEDRLAALRARIAAAREEHREGLRKYHLRFHSQWGQVMKTGYTASFFAHQVERFACLYTSHVGNLLLADPVKNYRAPIDMMPHEAAVPASVDMATRSFEDYLTGL